MLKLRGKTYQWSETIDGKRHRLSTGETDKTKAQLKVREYLRALKTGSELPTVGKVKHDTGLTLKLAFDRAFRQDWKGIASWQTYDINSRHAMRILGENLLLTEITLSKLRALKAELYDEEYSPATVNRVLTTLSSLFTLAMVHWEEIEAKPHFSFDKEENRRMRLVSPAEEIALLQAAPSQEMADLITHLSDTGCRLSEALRVSKADLDMDLGLIKLWKTKNRDPRAIPMTERLKALWERRAGASFSFTKDQAEYWFSKTKALAGVDDDELVMHSFRHTCATTLLEAKRPIEEVQHWLGHKSIVTTQRYAKMTHSRLSDAVKAFDQYKSSNATKLKVVG